jgi:anhydro-N-acetylmuramic acid kinase
MLIVGVMSGTSVDGIDIAVCEISSPHAVELVHFDTVPWDDDNRAMIFSLIHSESITLQQVSNTNFKLGKLFGEAVKAVLEKHGIHPDEVAAIASHGQTVYHEPPLSTLQIGEPSVIAQVTGVTTVADFRVADIAAGGQGAPLTSTFDWLVLGSKDLSLALAGAATGARASPAGAAAGCSEAAAEGGAGANDPGHGARARGWRAIQNIGGIGNVTLLPPPATRGRVEAAGTDGATPLAPLAFDTGPGNCLIDLAAMAVDPSLRCDMDGRLAAQVVEVEVDHSRYCRRRYCHSRYSRSRYCHSRGATRHHTSSHDVIMGHHGRRCMHHGSGRLFYCIMGQGRKIWLNLPTLRPPLSVPRVSMTTPVNKPYTPTHPKPPPPTPTAKIKGNSNRNSNGHGTTQSTKII